MTIRAKINELKSLRIKNGLSIRALSKVASLSTATILKIEHGTILLPSTAKKISDALDVSFDDLFEIVEDKGA